MSTYWQIIVDRWALNYYSAVLWNLLAFVALILALKNFRKNKVNVLFIIYLVLALIMSDPVFELLRSRFAKASINKVRFFEGFNIFFATVEFYVFLIFFKLVFNKRKLSYIIGIILVVFTTVSIISLCLVLFIFLTKAEIRRLSYYTNVVEYLVLTLFCLLYFYYILAKQISKIILLTKSPTFWITTGLFFYSIISLPFLIIGDTLMVDNEELYNIVGAIHYFSFSFLFICLIKAYTCRISLTT